MDTPNANHDDATYDDVIHVDHVGRTVVDEHQHVIGIVVDVVYDNDMPGAGASGEQAAWLVVDPGMFRAAHWMPAAGTYRSADGRIVTPWDRALVRRAPKANDAHVMTPGLAHELERHYEVATLQ